MKIKIGMGPGIGGATGMGAEGFFGIIDACERIGIDSIWFSERVSGDILDAMGAMGVAVGRTEKLKFGHSVLVLPGRNPVLLAKELATLDVLSNGRIVAAFGLGSPVGGDQQIFAADKRARRTDEATRLITKLWTEEDVTFHGEFYSVDNLTLLPKPVQEPMPDIWFGGHSEPACRRVGRIGTGWLPSFISPDEFNPKVDLIKEVAAENEREIEDDHYGALIPYVLDDGAADAVRGAISARRPEVDAQDIVPSGGWAGVRAHTERFIDAGATKFVLVPAIPPASWDDELQAMYDNVIEPLEN